ncbi:MULTISPECIES: class I SAM-dependent methyltransferase [unclassified Streptomyces]|uniref:class I SAM-dependent methyltransferase n=1 Tax=unclassified Streptomyces TaxID=2593676 RepID=UPI002253D46A|nr:MULTISPECIES: class I SAM-dependent methyltransferase [unclassified Streptomyces]MCX4631978.1 class I SAM-dependent methyltransferase [Streptomyces sp. NBC_01443]WSW47806.1 class I SAM-dependent methyltransferase [Streptomyces sp. NBC_01001]
MDRRVDTRRASYAELPEARPDSGARGQAYAVSAEFYDLLHARSYHRHALALAGPAAAARVGIVEVGAGTGLVTDVLIGASCVPVHAVEPAAAMRAVLLSRLHPPAGGSVGDRVTVHSCSAVELSLSGQADLAVCLRMASCLPPDERRALWRTLADLLVPGGLLFLDRPPARLPARPTRRSLGEVQLGLDTYRGQVTARAEGDRIRCDYAYLVCRQGRVLRRAQESFLLWPLTRQALGAELADAGLALEGELPPDLLRVRRGIGTGLPHPAP